MIALIITLSVFFLFVYPNSLFYTISLLLISSSILFNLSLMNFISSLLFLLLIIVYAGAIIILIGYVCAVCPNLRFLPSISYSLYPIFFSVFVLQLLSPLFSFPSFQHFSALFSFFYTSFGILLFLFLILFLFLTLLIVTSQYLSPKGPFRSTNV